MDLSLELQTKVNNHRGLLARQGLRGRLLRQRVENYRRTLMIDMRSYKPYRSKMLKAKAFDSAFQVKGTWVSPALRLYHPEPKAS